MHPRLTAALSALRILLENDTRCLGIYLHGSIGRGETDAYSDIDVCAVIADEAYEGFKAGMQGLCDSVFGPVVIWLPEGEQAGYCNYAFLFEHGDELLLTDFDIITRSLYVQWNQAPDQVLYDPTGLLATTGQAGGPHEVDNQRVARLIDTYWVYAYLNGKYWKRQDLYKLLYVQQTLMQLHVRVLNVLRNASEGHWWASDVSRLTGDDQERLRTYFSAATSTDTAVAFAGSVALFSEHARALCELRGMAYPSGKESAVLKHLYAMGLPVA